MSDTITLTGIVATLPRAITTGEGLAITSFRLASSQRRFDRAQERWVDGETNSKIAHPYEIATSALTQHPSGLLRDAQELALQLS
jgi:hypothetical protein